MLDFAIFAVIFVSVLIAFVFYLYPGSRKSGTTVPGMDPSDPREGNIPDIISKNGSLHLFLTDLHTQYGPISSFWLGNQLIISLASPLLFSEHKFAFDRPSELYEVYRPFVGDASVLFSDSSTARRRLAVYCKALDEAADGRRTEFVSSASELLNKLKSLSAEEHIPLFQYSQALVIKVLLRLFLGAMFDDGKRILEFRRHFDICYQDMETSQTEPEETNTVHKTQSSSNTLRNIIREALNSQNDGFLQQAFTQLKTSEEESVSDALTLLCYGYTSVSALMTWSLYYLATHLESQEKLHREIDNRFASGDSKDDSPYLNHVIKETLRLSAIQPFTARIHDIEVVIAGHKIPAKTPIIHALGCVLKGFDNWAQPDNFNPDRFNEPTPSLTFCPFGFAGKRVCPAENFTIAMVSTVLTTLLKDLKIKLAIEDSELTAVYKYGLVTRPEEEIWIKIQQRNL